MDIPNTNPEFRSPGVYTKDTDGNMKLVHAYQGGDYALEDITEYFQLGRLEPPLQGDETILCLDAAELRRLKTMADAYSFDYEEGFIEMCLEIQRFASNLPEPTFQFVANF